MAGTRLTVKKEPLGHYFSIRTPGTPERWAQFEEELDFWWSRLNEDMLSGKATQLQYVPPFSAAPSAYFAPRLLRPAELNVLRPASCVLRPASCVLRPASCVLRPASCVLRPASCVLRAGCWPTCLGRFVR